MKKATKHVMISQKLSLPWVIDFGCRYHCL